MHYQLRTIYLQISFIALTAYFTAMPHDSYAASYYYATCAPVGSVSNDSMICQGLTSSEYFSEGDTVQCNDCGTGKTGYTIYKCYKGEAGGYEGQGVYEGYWAVESNTCRQACTPNATQSCTTTAVAAGTQTCGTNMAWGRCVPTSCKSGYVLVPGSSGNHCYATCTIANGSGYMYVADPSTEDPGTDPEESSSSSSTTA